MSPAEITALEQSHAKFYAPTYQILVRGKDLLSSEKLEISTVQVDNTLEGADQFSFTVNSSFNFSLREFSRLENFFTFGAPVEIRMGYREVKEPKNLLLTGIITSIGTSFPSAGLPQINVKGYDHSYCMTKGKKSRNWKDKKDSDIATLIGEEHNLQTEVQDTRVVHPKIEQSQESDRSFLDKLAKRNGFEFYIFDRTMYFREPANDEDALITLEWGKGLVSFSPEINIAEQITNVEVRGWDIATKREIVGRAGPGDEPGRDRGARRSGGEYLRSVCRDEEETTLKVRRPVYSQQEADRRAEAILKQRSEQFVKGNGESIGLPEIRADRNIELKGLGRLFSRPYYIEQSTHTVSTSGYKTTFKVKDTTI